MRCVLRVLTPFRADLAAPLACFEPALPLEVPDHRTDASAIALSAVKELAKSAAAGMHRIVAWGLRIEVGERGQAESRYF